MIAPADIGYPNPHPQSLGNQLNQSNWQNSPPFWYGLVE